MKRAAAVVGAMALVLAGASLAAQAKANFAGKWVCTDCPAPGGGGGGRGGGMGGGGLGPEFTAAQDATTLSITRTMGENTVTLKYNLDGSESKNTMMGRGGQAQEHSHHAGRERLQSLVRELGRTRSLDRALQGSLRVTLAGLEAQLVSELR